MALWLERSTQAAAVLNPLGRDIVHFYPTAAGFQDFALPKITGDVITSDVG